MVGYSFLLLNYIHNSKVAMKTLFASLPSYGITKHITSLTRKFARFQFNAGTISGFWSNTRHSWLTPFHSKPTAFDSTIMLIIAIRPSFAAAPWNWLGTVSLALIPGNWSNHKTTTYHNFYKKVVWINKT